MSTDRARLSVSLPADLVKWVRERAAIEGVTISAIIERAIRSRMIADEVWPEPERLDKVANELYVRVVQPDTIWWDDLTPEMKDAWRRAARWVLLETQP